MTDFAIKRIQLVDNSHRRTTDGKRIHRMLPWQIVTYPEHIPMIEPVDIQPNAPTTTTKEITGIEFVDEDTLFKSTGFSCSAPYVRNYTPYS